MKKHEDCNYHVSWGYVSIRRSIYDEEQNCLRIEWMSDQPSSDEIGKFIEKEYPELKEKKIRFTYNDNEWISEWNLGEQRGCFMLMVIFFEG